MKYSECKYYEGGYCRKTINSFGLSQTCCERNDCPELNAQRKEIDWDKLKKITMTENSGMFKKKD